MLRALLCPLCQNLILLLLRELEVLLAEEPEPRSLRAILAAWVATAHVPLEAAGFPGNPVAAGLRQRSRDSLGEHLRKAINQGIEWVRGASGHMAPLLEERMVVQATYAHYGRGVCRDRPRLWPQDKPISGLPWTDLPSHSARPPGASAARRR